MPEFGFLKRLLSIDETNSPPLAQATIDKKGSDKPLIDSGEMRKSVRSEVE